VPLAIFFSLSAGEKKAMRVQEKLSSLCGKYNDNKYCMVLKIALKICYKNCSGYLFSE
jgi:hypothetical protein